MKACVRHITLDNVAKLISSKITLWKTSNVGAIVDGAVVSRSFERKIEANALAEDIAPKIEPCSNESGGGRHKRILAK